MTLVNGVSSIISKVLSTPYFEFNNNTSVSSDFVNAKLHSLENQVSGMISSSRGLAERSFENLNELSTHENIHECLRFSKVDARDKFLYLSSEDSLGFNPLMNAYKPKLLNDINKKFDLKFKVVKSYDEICHEVKEAAKIGKLTNVLIDANGESDKIYFSEYSSCLAKQRDVSKEKFCHLYDQFDRSLKINIDENKDFSECFKGLDVNGKISLLCNRAGAPNQKGNFNFNIAQKIANAAKRAVIAPVKSFIYHVECSTDEQFELFHPTYINKTPKNTENIFKLFNPIYENCALVKRENIENRENELIKVVKHLFTSILLKPKGFKPFEDLFKLCGDDPKEKFLFLSMEHDRLLSKESVKLMREAGYGKFYNLTNMGSLHPIANYQLLEQLSKNYDFKYKLVKSYEELCKEVNEAAKIGRLSNIIIEGHGHQYVININDDPTAWYGTLHRGRDFKTCFSSLDPSTKIALMSCRAGRPKAKDHTSNIAYEISRQIRNPIIAPEENANPLLVKVKSVIPFEIFQASSNDPLENTYKEFKQN